MKDVSALFVSPQASLRNVMACIDTSRYGIALVVDEDRHLLGVITDGDLRRAILAGVELTVTAKMFLIGKKTSPITAQVSTPHDALITLVRMTRVSHIPLLNDFGQVVELATLDDLLLESELQLQAVVMAGGYGTRLQPLTETLPKPMLQVGDRPLIEWIIEQLSHAGIRQVHITTHHLADRITEHFGDGQRFGVELKYVAEECSLGTAGGLGLIPKPDMPLLVINGDVLTRIDFRAMAAFHKEHCADLTVAVREHEIPIPYGVVDSEGPYVRRIKEKPSQKFFINAGVYVLEPDVHQFIPSGQRFDMTDMIQLLLDLKRTVVSFPIWEYWRDIGQPADYLKAQEDMKNGRIKA